MPLVLMRGWQTLLAKWGMATVMVPLLCVVTLVVAEIVGLDLPSYGWLWLFMSFGAITVAVGTLTLLAVFGNLGQLIALLFFVYLAMAASGATIPRQALPTFFRWVNEIDPLRRILDGVRSLLYFNGSMDAGLRHGIVLTALGLGFWIAVGTFVTRWYDRTGKERLSQDTLARIRVAAGTADP